MSPIADKAIIEKLSLMLIDTSLPLKLRFRILFTLKNLDCQEQHQGKQSEKTGEIVDAICRAFNDTSALLKHECAYCLGQMGNKNAINKLIHILNNTNEDPMVRHEAGEALGAMSCFDNQDVMDALTKQSQNPRAEIAETCQIALDRLNWLRNNASSSSNLIDKTYTTIDPAPPLPLTTVDELKTILLDENRSLFERYRAMFALRNIGNDEAVLAICEGFQASSALFRHETAFVLGQLQSTCSIPALCQQLSILDENYMVRHECAETLGSIGTDECRQILESYLNDKERVVRESCEVALDISDYVNSVDFQYCNGLKLVESDSC